MKKEYCVYMHTFPNEKHYIGQTKQKPKYRFGNGDGYKGCRYLYSAIQKYGWENIKHEILIDNLTQKEADYYEKYYIALYRSNNKEYGYNLQSGGTAGYEYTDEAKRLMAEKQKGRKQSAETRLKHSEALKRYYATHEVSEETRQKLRRANKGQFKKGVSHECSLETRKKISETLRGRKGKPLTEEERKHLSEVMKARGTTIQMLENITPHQFQKGHPPNEKAMQLLREKYSKKVIQYDLNGNKIAEYASITEASKLNGLTANAVGNCVRGNVLTTNGFIWKYADETFDISKIDRNKLQRSILAINTPRKIFKMDLDGNIIDEYDSISDAKRITGLYHIGEVLRGKRLTAGGYIWRYADGNQPTV